MIPASTQRPLAAAFGALFLSTAFSASAGAQEPEDPSLDALLRQAASENPSTLREAAGSPSPRPKSAAEALQSRLNYCLAAEADLPELRSVEVIVRASLDVNGRLDGSPQLVSRADGGDDDPYYTAVGEAAVRAVIRCAPYFELPSENYDGWENLLFTFNPVLMGEP